MSLFAKAALGQEPRHRLVWIYAFPLVVLALLGFIHFHALFNGPYIDDVDLIFGNSFIRGSHNPLLYWYRGQVDTKAWPLTHTVYWLSFRLFHGHYWAYRTLNLLLHWLTGMALFSYLLSRVRLPAAAFATAFFWLHPIAVEPVYWISQIGTLLTTLAFAGWFITLKKDGSARRSFFWLCGMLATKGFAYFLPILALRKTMIKTQFWRALRKHAPAFLITAYAILLVSIGVYASQKSTLGDFAHRDIKVIGSALAPQPVTPTTNIFSIPLSASSWYGQLSLCGKTALYYLIRLAAYGEFPAGSTLPADPNVGGLLFFSLGMGVLAALFWGVLRGWFTLASGILLFLPISGLFPAPFLNFSLVSDRMIYPALFVFAGALALLYEHANAKALRFALWLWPLLLGVTAFFAARVPRADFSYLLAGHS